MCNCFCPAHLSWMCLDYDYVAIFVASIGIAICTKLAQRLLHLGPLFLHVWFVFPPSLAAQVQAVATTDRPATWMYSFFIKTTRPMNAGLQRTKTRDPVGYEAGKNRKVQHCTFASMRSLCAAVLTLFENNAFWTFLLYFLFCQACLNMP